MPLDPLFRDAALDAVRDALLAADRVVITTHIRPDGDALGSEIAAALWLQKLGKTVLVVNADGEPRAFGWLLDPYREALVRRYAEGDLEQAEAWARADAVLVVDANAEHRLGATGKPARRSPGKKLLVDHHPGPEPWFDVACTRTDAAAAGELVYSLIAGHDPGAIDAPIATALYTAVMTDTGSFRYGATTPRTHAIVADVLFRGDLRPEPIHVATFDGRSRAGLRLLARALDTIATHYDGRLATMFVTQEMLRTAGAYFDETEGLVQYALALEGVQAAVILLETPSGVKASFRSTGTCPVNAWAARWGGGGHANAAGAYLTGRPLGRALKEIVDAAPPHVAAGPDALEAAAADDGPSEREIAALKAMFEGGR